MSASIILNLIFAVPVFATIFGMLMWAVLRSHRAAPQMITRSRQAMAPARAARAPERRSERPRALKPLQG